MTPHKIWLVLRREYLYNFRRPSFLFTAFGVPLLSLVAMFVLFQFTVKRESNLDDFQRVAYIDRAMILDPAGPNPAGYQRVVHPDVEMPVETSRGQTIGEYFNTLEQYASDQLVAGELDAYFVIPQNYTISGRVDLYSRKNVPQALIDDIEGFMRSQVAAKAPPGLPVPVARLQDQSYTLRDMDTGEELSDAALAGRMFLPFIFVMIYFMATNTTAQFLMSGVVEEKENRLMEILATSLRPAELLWGKLLGLGALSLTQIMLWAGAGLVISRLNSGAQTFLSGAKFQAGDIALIIVLFLVNFLLFSATMLGIGAAVTAEAESRQIAGFFTFLNVLPIMFLAAFISNPNGPLPVVLSFFPLTAAVSLTLRLGLTSLPMWQIALSVVVQFASALAVMWLAGKVFRLGMLMYGKRLTPRTVWAALREGRQILTAAPSEVRTSPPASRKRKGLFRR